MAIGSTPLGSMAIEVNIDDSRLRPTANNMKALMKSVNAEFVANMSAVKRTGSEMDILATRTEGLNKKFEVQKKTVQSLEEAYEKARKEAEKQGASQQQIRAAEAKRTALNREKASLNDLEGALQQAQKEQNEMIANNKRLESSFGKLDSQIKNTGDKLKGIGGSLTGIGQNMTMAVSAPILGLGAASVKAAGDAQAANAQFKTVFGDLESQADSSLNSIAEQTGLLPNSLKGAYTQIAAFAKTSGSDTKQALDITSRATMAAADSAAFYDKSIEEVTESLQSYLKGNFENDAALGISSTETTRNAKANELYKKSFNDLSESQKQLTLLAMVEDGNKLAGALGQAARESDTLSTQTSNVKTAFKDFMAEIGKPLLPIAVNLLKSMSGVAKDLSSRFSNMSGFGQKLVLGLGALVAVLPPILVGIGLMATGLGSIMALGAPLSLTVLGVVGGLALLATGLTLAYKNSETFRSVVNGAFNGIANTAKKVIGTIKGVFQLFKGNGTQGVITLSKFLPSSLVVGITKTVDTIKSTFKSMATAVIKVFKDIGKYLTTFWNENGKMIVQALKNVMKIVSPILKVLGAIFKGGFGAIKIIVSEVFKSVVGVIKGAIKIITGIMKVFAGLFTGNWKKMFSGIWDITKGLIQVIWNGINLTFFGKAIKGGLAFAKSFTKIFPALWKGITEVFSKSIKAIIKFVSEKWTSLNTNTSKTLSSLLKQIGEILKKVSKVFTDIFKAVYKKVKDTFDDILESAPKLLEKARAAVAKILSNLYKNFKSIMKDTYDKIKDTFSDILKYAPESFEKARVAIAKVLSNLYKGFKTVMKDTYDKVKDTFSDMLDYAPKTIGKTKDGVIKGLEKMRDGLSSLMKDMRKNISEGFDDMVDGAKALPKRLGDGISNGKDKAVQGVKTLGNSLIGKLGGVVNGTIGGINTVTSKLGIDKKISDWKIPKFSTGTKNGALAQNSLITVGDKGKGNWKGTRELVQFPNGKMSLFNKETTFHAPKGTKVFSNYETEHMIGTAYKFSTGTGVGGFFGSLGKNIINGFGDVMDWIAKPTEFVNKMIKGVIDKTGFGNLKGFGLDLAKGGFGLIKNAVMEFITGAFNESGTGDGGVLDISKLSYHYGKDPAYIAETGRSSHEGVDFSYVYDKVGSTHSGIAHVPPFMANGYGKWIKIVQGALSVIYGHMSKIFVKDGQKVKVGQALGITGDTGFSTGPHLHYEMRKNGQHFDPEPFLRKQATTAGASGGNWSGTVMKALALAGLPTTSAYKNAWLSQIQSESGGNPKAVQHGYVDVNTGGNEARGLVQVIPPTFNAFKLAGHNNIMNPLDNLIAGMRYAKSRYGSSLLSVIGKGHGYRTGGLVFGKQLAWLDEDNKGEAVIPFDPARRADAMKLLAYTAMKIMPREKGGQGYRPNSLPNVNLGKNNNDSELMKMMMTMIENQDKQLKLQQQQIEAIQEDRYTVVEANGRAIAEVTHSHHENMKQRKQQFKPSLA
ncbi:peptidoglycan DD-metalloendopeptidase family protein [Macrococcus carouselicus]|uniref:Probable transglycosylase IsaA n=1 Tax=Macrococcus carouselicus TaxID=69969 RepID=A0A9Q8FRH1_9STAP|nr:peptidoglycan DD-metalloendopeptidase family protein [Macrococcus carouselicus]TDM04069.1 hypothetical protein ERX40_02555 [Macrococcus carouselicus]